MATAVLPATDSLAHQDNNIINDKLQKVKEADGASYLSSPEASPLRDKIFPSSPAPATLLTEIVPTKPATINPTPLPTSAKVVEPAPSNPLRSNVTISSDPLEFVAAHYARLSIRPEHVEESVIEKQIIKAVSRKQEELLERRRRERELALALEERIRERSSLLVQLQADMNRKVKHIDSKKDALEQFRVDFAEQVKQQVPSSSTPQKSSLNRMQEEKEKKKLLAEWRNSNSEDTLQQLRKSILASQDEVSDLNIKIVNLKQELDLLHRMAEKNVSSNYIMEDLREKREQDRLMGIPRPYAEAKPKGPPAPPVVRSHLTRMQEEKERKMRARGEKVPSSPSSYPSYVYACSPSNFASSSSSSRTAQAQ